MEIKHSNVLALRMTYILLTKYEYRFIIVQNDQQNIWLANLKADSFPLIKIASINEQEGFYQEKKSKIVVDQVNKTLNKNMDLLVIYTDNEETIFKEEQRQTVCGSNVEGDLSPELLAVFPEFKECFIKVEDPQKECNAINTKIDEYQKGKLVQQKGFFKFKIPPVTAGIMLFCLAVYLIGLYLATMASDQIAIAITIGAYYQAFVEGLGQYWRFLTAGFVHIDIWHLAMNLYALFNVGLFLEPVLGKWKYLSVLIAGIIGGTWLVYVGQGNTVVLGISGGIYALFAILIVYFLKSGMFSNPQLRREMMFLVFINIMISMIPNVSWLGHFGGAVVGLLLGLIYFYQQQRALFINSIVASVILVGILTYLTIFPKPLDTRYLGTDNAVVAIYKKLGFDKYGDKVIEKMGKYYGGK